MGNEKLMSLLPTDKCSKQMQQRFVHAATIFSNLGVRELPLRGLLQNCVLVIQSTQNVFIYGENAKRKLCNRKVGSF